MNEKYKKAVFLCDLDGTLLNGNAELPAEAVQKLCALAEAGVRVSFATARTIRSVKYILAGIPFTLPVSLMNGVLLRDMNEGKYVSVKSLEREKVSLIRAAYDAGEVSPFVYFLDESDELLACYEEITCDGSERFMRERMQKYSKPFTCCEKGNYPNGTPIYFSAIDYKDKILKSEKAIAKIEGIGHTCYKSTYDEDMWYLEVFAADASKKSAAEELRCLSRADRIVCFGDNRNDIPMFEASDEGYAVEGAPDDLLRIADETVPCADKCGAIDKIIALSGIRIF